MIGLISTVAGGAAIGALLRYATMQLAQPLNQRWPLPVTTLTLNLSGAFLLGWDLTSTLPPLWQLFLGTGILGGLTTFSTMINEIVILARHQQRRVAFVYLGLSLVGGLFFGWLGTLICN